MKQNIIDAIRNDKLYGFIANNYWKLDNNTLIDLLKESIFLLNEEQLETLEFNLKDICEWEVK